MNRLLIGLFILVIFSIGLSACGINSSQAQDSFDSDTPSLAPDQNLPLNQPDVTTTPLPARPPYPPGEQVDYLAQTGDTIASLAKRFNTSVDEILAANSFIPADATTMPPGMPMKIPIYYQPFWGRSTKSFQIACSSTDLDQVGFRHSGIRGRTPRLD
jgi:hypothetical protein